MNAMTNLDSAPGKAHIIRLDLDWRWHRPKRRASLPKGEPRHDERPIRCIEDSITVGATTTGLPYPDQSCSSIDCSTVFAYVRNDEGLAKELRRVIQDGGTVRLRVPSVGPLAGFDAFNLHRYLVDISKRGLRPFETADIGWRRHYSLDDLQKMLGEEDFEVVTHRQFGVAASEAIRMTGFVLFRWFRPSRDRYRTVSSTAQRVMQWERSVTWAHGFWLEAEFVRTKNALVGFDERES